MKVCFEDKEGKYVTVDAFSIEVIDHKDLLITTTEFDEMSIPLESLVEVNER